MAKRESQGFSTEEGGIQIWIAKDVVKEFDAVVSAERVRAGYYVTITQVARKALRIGLDSMKGK